MNGGLLKEEKLFSANARECAGEKSTCGCIAETMQDFRTIHEVTRNFTKSFSVFSDFVRCRRVYGRGS
jgi:hypothetical protein